MKFTRNHIWIGLFAFILYGALVIFDYNASMSFTKADFARNPYSGNLHNTAMFLYRTIYLTVLFLGTNFIFYVLKPKNSAYFDSLLMSTVSFSVALLSYMVGSLNILPFVAAIAYVVSYSLIRPKRVK